MEQSLEQVREECDELHEELAFRENELEETRLELEVDKQQLQNELTAAKDELELASQRHPVSSTNGTSSQEQQDLQNKQAADEDAAYVGKLEEELELVTEQLIDMEKRLSETEDELQSKKARLEAMEQEGRRDEDQDVIRSLQADNADHLESEQRLRDEVAALTEELSLAREEVALQQEELQAAEEDYKATKMSLEEESARHKEEVTQLSIQLKEAEVQTKASLGEAALVATTIQNASEENEGLREELAALESALANAKEDYQNVLDELDAVNARFDEVRDEARREAREETTEVLRAAMKSDTEHEVNVVKEQLAKLAEENKILQEKVDATEVAVAAAKDMQTGAEAAESELVKQLQTQLARAKEDLAQKEKEMKVLTTTMEERLRAAEKNVSNLESQLHTTKGKLAEAEANIIVLKRDKERSEIAVPKSPTRARQTVTMSPDRPQQRSLSIEREELSSMSTMPLSAISQRRNRSRSSSPSSVMKLEIRLAEETQKLSDLQQDYDTLQDQKRMGEIRIKRLEEDVRVLQKQLFASGNGAVATQMTRLSSLASSEKGMDVMTETEMDGSRVAKIIESRDVKEMANELKALDKKCNSQREYNAQLLSKMLHLQGNIQVYCRVRPTTLTEIDKGYQTVADALSETEVGCFDSRTNKWKSFAFDRVWGPDQSQQSVFQDVEPVALSVVDGFNACIFAYVYVDTNVIFALNLLIHVVLFWGFTVTGRQEAVKRIQWKAFKKITSMVLATAQSKRFFIS